MRAERELGYLRVLLVLFNAVVFLGGDRSSTLPWLAYATLWVSLAYAFLVLLLRLHERYAFLLSGLFTTVADSVLISAWIAATGGADSPFHPLWFGSVAAVSLRFDLPRTVGIAVAYAFLHLAIVASLGQLADAWRETLVLGVYLLFMGFVAGFGARYRLDESARRLEATSRMADARAAEAKFRGLLEFSPDPVVVVDGRRRITIMNGGAESVFQVRRADHVGRDVTGLLAERSREDFERWHAAGLARGAGNVARTAVFRGRRGDDDFPLEVSTRPLGGEEGVELICVMRDMTERLAAEEERVANTERLREIERLKEIDRFKTQFINTAAHELGTPLTPIKIQLHMLETTAPERLDPKQRRALEILKRNVGRLSGLVQDLLDTARVQAGRLVIEPKPVDLNHVVLEAVESFEEPARREGITLRSSLTPNLVVPADEKRLTQVLFNLLSNAIKFSPAGSEVTVTTERRGDQAAIHVKDTGIGIDPKRQDRLFQPFSQLQDPKERTRAGSGLGLYITRSLVELHGGRITLQSQGSGHGSTFTVTLPTGLPSKPRESTPVAAPAPRRAAPPRARDDLQSRINELV